jgi:hypothetical protein
MKKKTEICIYESSMILSSNFNFDTHELRVEFKGGTIYQFENVELEDYLAFSNGESIGKSFNEYIRKYNGTKSEVEKSTFKE